MFALIELDGRKVQSVYHILDSCFSDDVLGVHTRRPISDLFVQNKDGNAGFNHPCDYSNRYFILFTDTI